MSCRQGFNAKFAGSVPAVNLRSRDITVKPLSAESPRSTEMKTLLLAGATVALLTAVNFAAAMAQGPKLSSGNSWAGITQPVDDTEPVYPIPRTMYKELIAKYRIGSAHKAVYANLTGNQMWAIIQSTFGQPSQQSAIAEVRRVCEDHATQTNLDPGKCVPVAVDDQQVFDPRPRFSGIMAQTPPRRLRNTVAPLRHHPIYGE